MTPMLILNAVLALAIVTAILSLLGWGILTDRTRLRTIHRPAARRARPPAGGQAVRGGRSGFARAPELSA